MDPILAGQITSGLELLVIGLLIALCGYKWNKRTGTVRALAACFASVGGAGITTFHIAQTWNSYLISTNPGWVYYLGLVWWASAIIAAATAFAIVWGLTGPFRSPDKA